MLSYYGLAGESACLPPISDSQNDAATVTDIACIGGIILFFQPPNGVLSLLLGEPFGCGWKVWKNQCGDAGETNSHDALDQEQPLPSWQAPAMLEVCYNLSRYESTNSSRDQ